MSEQRVGIVTGGGRRWGMGWQIAMGLANKGLDLAIADIREDWGKEAAESIKAETGRRVIFVKTDVSKRDSVQAMTAKVIAEFGRVDVLVNDAAIDPGQPAEDFTDELFDRIMNVNLRGTALCCQAVIAQMRKQNYGRIVNISSGGAVQPVRGLAIYCASKAGVIAYSKVLAREVARDGIVVTVVAPGVMHTAMGSETAPTQEDFERSGRKQLLKRPLYPSEVAEVVVLAATHPSHVLTGQTLHANGGGYMV
ncbi:MAG TPA: SDR family oxidoreductase [Candidatus Binataceae bacterium]|nr:SDR family oxidoreductase [Candidatus Binataceae bacterium]